MLSRIKILDDQTINKIAAGEVVDRPASVVKELLENAIDAGSSRITISILEGGQKQIRITDDGNGISPDDLKLAVLRHTTSKIKSIDDLYNLSTMGFRGEALASISAVSKMSILTKVATEDYGRKLSLEGSKVKSEEILGASQGTTITVEDLFFNTPARKKFLKSPTSESIQISEVVTKIALSHPQIQFKYMNNNKIMLTTPGDGNFISAIRSIYGRDISSNLFEVDFEEDSLKLSGYIGNSSLYKSNRKYQCFYVNGRYIKNRVLSGALEDVFKSKIPLGKFPVGFLMLDIDPQRIDVNIHPSKMEIKFDDERNIESFLLKALEGTLAPKVLIPKVETSNFEEKKEEKPKIIIELPKVESKEYQENNEKEVSSFKESGLSFDFSNPIPTFKEEVKPVIPKELPKREEIPIAFFEEKIEDEKEEEEEFSFESIQVIGRTFETYIIGSFNNSMYLIDQHAAHERIIYEDYLNSFKKQNISRQVLLTPSIMEFPIDELEKIESVLDELDAFGFAVELFGEHSIAIREVPSLFTAPESEKFILDILEQVSKLKNTFELKSYEIASMACKAAVKARDFLHPEEMRGLLRQLDKCKDKYTCPHGRPIFVEFSKKDIEKMFKRIL